MRSQKLPWNYAIYKLSSSHQTSSNSGQSTKIIKIILLCQTVLWFLAALFIFHAGPRGLGSDNFRNSSYKEKTAGSARVSRLSFPFLWLCFLEVYCDPQYQMPSESQQNAATKITIAQWFTIFSVKWINAWVIECFCVNPNWKDSFLLYMIFQGLYQNLIKGIIVNLNILILSLPYGFVLF